MAVSYTHLCGSTSHPYHREQEVVDILFRNIEQEYNAVVIACQQTPKKDGSPFLCLSDFIRPLSSGIPDTLGAFASSIDADMEGLYEHLFSPPPKVTR